MWNHALPRTIACWKNMFCIVLRSLVNLDVHVTTEIYARDTREIYLPAFGNTSRVGWSQQNDGKDKNCGRYHSYSRSHFILWCTLQHPETATHDTWIVLRLKSASYLSKHFRSPSPFPWNPHHNQDMPADALQKKAVALDGKDTGIHCCPRLLKLLKDR